MRKIEGLVPRYNVVCIFEHYAGHSSWWERGDIYTPTITVDEAQAIAEALNMLHPQPCWIVKEVTDVQGKPPVQT